MIVFTNSSRTIESHNCKFNTYLSIFTTVSSPRRVIIISTRRNPEEKGQIF